jgi:hypothetical protein
VSVQLASFSTQVVPLQSRQPAQQTAGSFEQSVGNEQTPSALQIASVHGFSSMQRLLSGAYEQVPSALQVPTRQPLGPVAVQLSSFWTQAVPLQSRQPGQQSSGLLLQSPA